MKINSELLKRFITKATLNANLFSMVIKVNSEGMFAQQKDLSNAAMTTIKLDKSKIKDLWTVEEKLCIKNTNMLIRSLASFSGEVELKKVNNILSVFNSERQIDIVLSSEQFIECNLTEIPEGLLNGFDAGFNIASETFKKIVSDMSIVSGKSIQVEIAEKKLILSTGEKGFDTISVKAAADYNNCIAKYGELLAHVIEVVDEKINVSLKKDFPIRITEVIDGINCCYIIAPLVESE